MMKRWMVSGSILAWAAGALALAGTVQCCSTVASTATFGVPITAQTIYKSDTALSSITFRQSFVDSFLIFTGPADVSLLSPYDASCTKTVTVGTASDYLIEVDCPPGVLLSDSAAHPVVQFRYVADTHDRTDTYMIGCTTDPPSDCSGMTQSVTITG